MIDAPIELSPQQAMQAMLGSQRYRSERVIYYQKPAVFPDGKPNLEANWITWGDTQQHKAIWLMARGFKPLYQFGYIETKHRETDPDSPFDQYGVWGPILTHPDGPALFPVDQIVAYRWYDPQHVGVDVGNGRPAIPIPGVKFPQLREFVAKGGEITVFACPECTDRVFHHAIALARHLRNRHDYQMHEIIALGKELNVDFTREFGSVTKRVIEYAYPDEEPTAAPRGESELAVPRKTVRVPSREELQA